MVDHLYSVIEAPPSTRPGTRSFHIVYSGILRIARTEDLSAALKAFQSDLRLAVAASAKGRLFVHAGVVAHHGQALLLPGRTFTGKSTLVAALVRAGATYYSDEYAVLDRRGRVHPFAAPLSLRDPSGTGRPVAIDQLGGKAGTQAIPVKLIAFLEYRPKGRWRPKRLSVGETILGLFDNTVAARAQGNRAIRILSEAALHAVAFKGARGEADATAAALLQRLRAD